VRNTTTYVGIHAHKKDLFIAMLVADFVAAAARVCTYSRALNTTCRNAAETCTC
jgi:hypothetical protein